MLRVLVCLIYALLATPSLADSQSARPIDLPDHEISLIEVLAASIADRDGSTRLTYVNAASERRFFRIESEIFKPVSFSVRMGTDPVLIVDYPYSTINTRASQGPRHVSEMIIVEPSQTIDLWFNQDVGTLGNAASLSLVPERLYQARIRFELQLHSAYYGVALLLVIFLITFSILLRSRAAMAYAAFLLSLVLLNTHSYGVFSGSFSFAQDHFFYLFRPLQVAVMMSYLIFASSFLDLDRRYPRVAQAFKALIFLMVVSLVAQTFFDGPIITALSVFIPISFILLGVLATLIAIFRRSPGSLIFAAGFIVLATYSNINYLTTILDFPLTNLQLDLVTIFGQLLDAGIFTAAIVAQSFQLRKDRDRALREQLSLYSELNKAELDLQRAQRLARHHKQQLNATSHDLRQPINAMSLAADEAQRSDPEVAAKIKASLEYIQNVIAGKDERRDPDQTQDDVAVPVEVLFENLRRLYSDAAIQKGLDLRFAYTSLRIEGSVVSLIRILSNLVSNAIKYTAKGRVLIGARPRGTHVRIEVWDTGPGLSEADRKLVFNRSARGPNTATIEGDGVGLAICRDLAKKEGWTINVRSVEGRGSIFLIEDITRRYD
ncbi:MAG: sensor histidine kinase [Pseudomonadota bacterium]